MRTQNLELLGGGQVELAMRSRHRPLLVWPNSVWIFVATEAILLLSVRYVAVCPLDALDPWQALRELFLGNPAHDGLVARLKWLNLMVVASLWIAVVCQRQLEGENTAVASLVAALLLYQLSAAADRLATTLPHPVVLAVMERTPAGHYEPRLRPFPDDVTKSSWSGFRRDQSREQSRDQSRVTPRCEEHLRSSGTAFLGYSPLYELRAESQLLAARHLEDDSAWHRYWLLVTELECRQGLSSKAIQDSRTETLTNPSSLNESC